MIEHVWKFPKIQISHSYYFWKTTRVHESFYQRFLFYTVVSIVIWVALMAWVALKTPFGNAFHEAARQVGFSLGGRLFGNFSIQEVDTMVLLYP